MAARRKTDAESLPEGDFNDSYESSLAALSQIVSELEAGELGLTQSLERYEQGIRMLRRCHGYLEKAEQRVSQLVGFDDEGAAILKKLDQPESDEGLQEKQQSRVRRRTGSSSQSDELF
jgi:exodeoxyribonuclease VII small subunit